MSVLMSYVDDFHRILDIAPLLNARQAYYQQVAPEWAELHDLPKFALKQAQCFSQHREGHADNRQMRSHSANVNLSAA